MSVVWPCRLLRGFGARACAAALHCNRTPHHRFVRARRNLGMVLFGPALLRSHARQGAEETHHAGDARRSAAETAIALRCRLGRWISCSWRDASRKRRILKFRVPRCILFSGQPGTMAEWGCAMSPARYALFAIERSAEL